MTHNAQQTPYLERKSEMHRKPIFTIAIGALVAQSATTYAISLRSAPTFSSTTLGFQAVVNLNISGLVSGAAHRSGL